MRTRRLVLNRISRQKGHFTSPLRVIVFVFCVVWCLSLYFCLAWLFMTSLKDRIQYLLDPVGLPDKWHFENYINAFTQLNASGKNLFLMLFNTLWLTFGNITLQMFFALCFSYVVARFKFPGRNVIYWVIILQMMITVIGSLPATYTLYNALGIYDSPLFLLTNLGGTSGFLIFYATFKSMPNAYNEAAFIDGAGHIRAFFKVMLPQVAGIISALAVSSFIANWNEYMTPILYLPSYPTLASGLYAYQIEFARRLNYPLLFAGLFMTIIPCLVMYFIFQKQFLNINIGGGLKG